MTQFSALTDQWRAANLFIHIFLNQVKHLTLNASRAIAAHSLHCSLERPPVRIENESELSHCKLPLIKYPTTKKLGLPPR